jgi:preprotein translocase subunit SecG
MLQKRANSRRVSMSKIKKVFTTIISAIIVFFVKMGITNADVMIPSNNGRYIPQSVYGVQAPPMGFRIAMYVHFGLLVIALPLLIIFGIITFVKIRNKEKEQNANADINSNQTGTTEIMELKRSFKMLTIWTIIVAVVAFGIFIVLKILSNNFGIDY